MASTTPNCGQWSNQCTLSKHPTISTLAQPEMNKVCRSPSPGLLSTEVDLEYIATKPYCYMAVAHPDLFREVSIYVCCSLRFLDDNTIIMHGTVRII